MYGLEAINANNGWAISVVGITIVFSGLVLLSLVISQLHKVLALYEDPSLVKKFFSKKSQKKSAAPDEIQEKPAIVLTPGQKESIKQFSLLAQTMGAHFPMPKLLNMAKASGVGNPHETLNLIIELEIIQPDHEGFFIWNSEAFESAVAG